MGLTPHHAPPAAPRTPPGAAPAHQATHAPARPAGAVLAIDAGNSKTDVALIAPDGQVTGTARAGGFHPARLGPAGAVDVLAGAVTEVLGGATGRPHPVAHVAACLANVDLPVEEEQLAAELHRRGWAPSVDVRNDTFAILRAGIAEPRGVAVVCGTGINCVGMLPDGRTARFPALGRISGDWGGGWGLVEEAIWHAARAEDGRGGPTALARTLPAHFDLASVYALIEGLHLKRISEVQCYQLAPVVFATAADGDPVARSLVDRLADEVVVMVTVALDRLGLRDAEVPVLLGGGLLAARHPQLDGRVQALLAERAPRAVPRVVTAKPVLGAALLGLDHTGAPPDAHARVRAYFGFPSAG